MGIRGSKLVGPLIAAAVIDLFAYVVILLFVPSAHEWLNRCEDSVPRTVGENRCGRPNSLVFFVPFALAMGVAWFRSQRALRP